jgi:autotransporter-associated beta strand protein
LAAVGLLFALSTSAAAATHTWDGGGSNSSWTTAANWAGDVAPSAGDDLIFPADAAQLSNSNNFPILTRFNSITFTGGDYVINGNPVTLGAGIRAEAGTQAVNIPVNLAAAQSFTSDGSALLTVNLLVNTNGFLLRLDGTGLTAVLALITGSGGVTKDGTGAALLFSGNTYTGPTTVLNGILAVDGSQPNSAAEVNGGALGGTGTVGPVTVTTGVVSAGTVTSPTGILNVRGRLRLTQTGSFLVKLNGNTAGSGHDQLNVTGPVEIGDANLIVLTAPEFTPADGAAFTVINNDESDPVVGAFAGLPEGTLFTTPDGVPYRISYVGGTGNDVTLTRASPPPGSPTLQFSSPGYTVGEGDGRATITVTRGGGDPSLPLSVSYGTSNGSASERSDYTTALGRLDFAPGETSKSFSVLITDDAYVESSETVTLTLSRATGGAFVGSPGTATLTIVSDDTAQPTSNPVDRSEFFVRQHYADFLNREPDPQGLAFWTQGLGNLLARCDGEPTQDARRRCVLFARAEVSAAFFLSIEFQQTGYFAIRLYQASFGQLPALPRFRQFLGDAQEIQRGVVVGVGDWAARLEANKAGFAEAWASRPEFMALYGGLSSADYVNTLFANAGVGAGEEQPLRAALVDGLNNGTETRATALRKVAESKSVYNRVYNPALVLMQYYGYLRRNPNDPPDSDFGGYNFWLAKLNSFSRDDEDLRDEGTALARIRRAQMVEAFIDSIEYRQRFAP